MLCPECKTPNPETNRFCGMCGHALQAKPLTNYPREGYDEVDSGADLEIAQIDPRIPASEYAPPRAARHNDAPLLSEQERMSDEEEERVREEQVRREAVEHYAEPVRAAEPEPPRYERPRSSTSIFDLEPREEERPRFVTDPHQVTPVTYDHHLQDDSHHDARAYDLEPEPESSRAHNALHGPSFLGLGEPDFLDDLDEPESHSRRNWLVVALIAVIAIGAVEWRNIRDTGIKYAGTMHFSMPGKKGEGPAKVTPEDAPSASGESSAAADGKPEIVVNPTTNNPQNQNNNPAQNNSAQNGGAAPAGTDQSQQNADASKNTDASAQNGGNPPPPSSATAQLNKNTEATPAKTAADAGKGNQAAQDQAKEVASSKKPEQPAAKNADNGDTSDAEAADDTAAAKPAKTTRNAKRPAKPSDAVASSAGADDLARAEQASDPATAANWLWAATKKGNMEAPVRLADYYANGRGVPKDCEQATVLLRSSARRGNPRARARLGMYYATGQCVPQDRTQAWHWLSLAHQADPGSDWIEQYRQRLWSQMTPDERSRSNANSTASE